MLICCVYGGYGRERYVQEHDESVESAGRAGEPDQRAWRRPHTLQHAAPAPRGQWRRCTQGKTTHWIMSEHYNDIDNFLYINCLLQASLEFAIPSQLMQEVLKSSKLFIVA